MHTFITFQDTPEIARKLRVAAAERDMSRSEALRQACRMWLASNKNSALKESRASYTTAATKPCPFCDGLIFIFKDGVRYCDVCGEAVAPAVTE